MKTALALLCACFLMAACGGDVAAVGVYQVDTAAFREAMVARGKDLPADEQKKQLELLDRILAGMTGAIELQSNGTAKVDMTMMGQTQTGLGTWQLAGTTLSITSTAPGGKPETKTATLVDSVITIEQQVGPEAIRMLFRRR